MNIASGHFAYQRHYGPVAQMLPRRPKQFPVYYRGKPYHRRNGRNGKRGRKTYMEYKEIKFHDIDVVDVTIAADGNIAEDSILTIAQGDTSTTRTGRQIFVKSVLWRYELLLPSSTATGATSDTVRVVMYLDHQANGASAAVTDIMSTNDFQSFKNLHVGTRFSILHDKTYSLNTGGFAGNGTAQDSAEVRRNGRMFKEFKRHVPILYNSTAGIISEMEQKNIGILLFSRAGLVGFDSKVRVRFHD